MLGALNSSARLVLAATLISYAGNAMAQDYKPPQSNTMGAIINNQGIVTQGQFGNNTIINPIRREPNGFYQGDTLVGRSGAAPTIDEASGIVSFPVVGFTAPPDPSKPLEFGNLLLSTENAPRPRPNSFTTTFSAAIAGFQARIVGRK
jgi:hypothetical protein